MASLSSFTIATLFCLGFVLVASIMFAEMNHQYSENINYGFNDTTNSFQKFIDYQDKASDEVKGGEIGFTGDSGITMSSTGVLFLGIINLVSDFISGSFIYQATHGLYLGTAGDIIGRVLQMIYIITLWVFIPLFIVLNRKT